LNLLSTGICETKEGELLIVWGGRRIVTRYLTPPLADFQDEPGIDSGPLVITRIYDNLTKRQDYNAITFGRNAAVIKDETGRIWVGYRIPVISAQDDMGVNYYTNPGYVKPMNVGTTAGMNFWEVARADDVSLFKGAWPWSWDEQTAIPKEAVALPDGFSLGDFTGMGLQGILTYLDALSMQFGESGLRTEGMDLFTDWTYHRITGRLMLRGMGANEMDMHNILRWKWYADEGLKDDTSVDFTDYGTQLRLSKAGEVYTTLSDENNPKSWGQSGFPYGISGCVRRDKWNRIFIAGYKQENGSILWELVGEDSVATEPPGNDEENEEQWAVDNEKEWVIANANIPGETYSEAETPPTPEQEEETKRTMAGYYYALPTVGQQRIGYCISRLTGLHFVSWMHGNLTAVERNNGYKAVGLRIAVSRNEGKSFEPLIPERVGGLNGV